MKILKVKVKKERTPVRCHYSYPDSWDSRKIDVLAYEEHPENIGKVEEDCLCVTDDEMAGRLLKEDGVREVSREEANAFARKCRPARLRITDEQRVTSIVGKMLSNGSIMATLKKQLTKEELDALDENSKTAGIGKSKEFNIEEFLNAS